MVAVAEQEAREVTLNCQKHGDYQGREQFFPVLNKTMKSECPACKEARETEEHESERRKANFERDTKIRHLMHGNGIPKRFENKSFEGYVAGADRSQQRALKICQAYADKFEERLAAGGGLVLCGAPGTGKTHLACAIANQVIKNYAYAAVFMSVLQAVRGVKETYAKGSEITEAQAYRRLCEPELLILDEVGVQFGSDAEKLILFEIVNMRYQDMKPTILISNLRLEELKSFIGERVVDRMQEGGGAVVSFEWGSYRSAI